MNARQEFPDAGLSAPPTWGGIGHNSGIVDPGPATDFSDQGPLSIRIGSVSAEKLQAFYEAVRSQGNADVRQTAISNMLARARANPAIRHHDYRLLEQIALCCRWEYRYCCQSNKALAYFAAQADTKNMGRSLSSLADAGTIAGVEVPRRIGGWPMTYYTLRCTAEDRSDRTLGNLNEAFKVVVSCRQPDDLLPSSRQPDDISLGQVVSLTTCKSSGGGVASRPPDAQSVYRGSVEKTLSSADADGVRATDLLSGVDPPKPKKLTDAEIEESFRAWYEAYPRKAKPDDARRAYAKLIKSGRATGPQLLAAVRAYPFRPPRALKSDTDYRPYPASWLNGGSWQEGSAVTSLTFDEEVAALREKHPDFPIEEIRQAVNEARKAQGLD